MYHSIILLTSQEVAFLFGATAFVVAVVVFIIKNYWQQQKSTYQQAVLTLPFSTKKHPSLAVYQHRSSLQLLSLVLSMSMILLVFSCSIENAAPNSQSAAINLKDFGGAAPNGVKMASPPVVLITKSPLQIPESLAAEKKKPIPTPIIPEKEEIPLIGCELPIDFEKDPEVDLEKIEEKLLPLEEDQQDPIFKIVEEMPYFSSCEEVDYQARKTCGDKKMLSFIYSQLQYPPTAIEHGIEGMVVISFVVNKEGRLEDPKILRDIGGETGKEALRIIQLMNELPEGWTPGKQRGIPVKVNYNLPIRFRIPVYNSNE